MESDAASFVQGMNAFGQHQAFVNDRWMATLAMLLEKATASSRSEDATLNKSHSLRPRKIQQRKSERRDHGRLRAKARP